jgi:quercetin dioxygenase-like cupin family protein
MKGAQAMSFFDPAERATKTLMPGVVTRTFWGDRMLLSLVDLTADAHIPLHSHPYEQAGMLLSGEIELTIGAETRCIKAGEIYMVPLDVPHGVNMLGMPAQLIEAFSPVREDYKY